MCFQPHSKSAYTTDLHVQPSSRAIRPLFTRLKPILIMKLAMIFVLAACLQVSAKSYSQLITLRERNVPVEQVLQKIKTQSGYNFFYNLKTLKLIGRISIDVKNATISEALDVCFRNSPLTYSISGNIIVISKRDEKPVSTFTATEQQTTEVAYALIRGKVENDKSQPLAGATVAL